MEYEQIEKTIYNIYEKIYKQIEISLSDKFYKSELYDLHLDDILSKTIAETLKELLNKEKAQNKIINTAVKKILAKNRDIKKQEKEIEKKGIKLWKLTRGNIPCINGCGRTTFYTKQQLKNGEGKHCCKECCDSYKKDQNDDFPNIPRNIWDKEIEDLL